MFSAAAGGFIYGVPQSGPVGPAPTTLYGWFSGGLNQTPSVITEYSTVNRITYTTDTATASTRGPLTSTTYGAAQAGTGYYGWIAGGGPGSRSTVQRIDYALDTATASTRGPLSESNNYSMGAVTDNTTYGWYGGGFALWKSTVQRITYATDTATATIRGPLTQAKFELAGSSNTTYGWFGGGRAPSQTPAQVSTVDRITYATDTATASVRGPLSILVEAIAAIGTVDYGWFGGGYVNGAGKTSIITRITYATDTATSTNRGPLTITKSDMATSGTDTYGWFGGGAQSGPAAGQNLSSVDRITYSTDTATATARGPLSISGFNMTGSGSS